MYYDDEVQYILVEIGRQGDSINGGIRYVGRPHRMNRLPQAVISFCLSIIIYVHKTIAIKVLV